MSSLVWGNSNAPRKTLPPRCCQCVYSLRTRPWEWLRLISQSVWLEAGQSNCLGPPFFPWLSYHRVLLLTPVFGHTREPQITCCPALLSPLHTNSSTLFVFLSLCLWSLMTHTVVCSRRTWYCRYVMQTERLYCMTSAFPLPCLYFCCCLFLQSSGSFSTPRPLLSPPLCPACHSP